MKGEAAGDSLTWFFKFSCPLDDICLLTRRSFVGEDFQDLPVKVIRGSGASRFQIILAKIPNPREGSYNSGAFACDSSGLFDPNTQRSEICLLTETEQVQSEDGAPVGRLTLRTLDVAGDKFYCHQKAGSDQEIDSERPVLALDNGDVWSRDAGDEPRYCYYPIGRIRNRIERNGVAHADLYLYSNVVTAKFVDEPSYAWSLNKDLDRP